MTKFQFGGVTVNSSGQSVVGENNGGMQMGGGVATVASLFDALSKALPADDSEQTQLAHEALGNIELAANASHEVPAVTAEQKSSMMAMMAPYMDKLAPYAPTLAKALLAFGDGYFSTLETRNPVVAGVVSMFRAIQ